MVKPSKSPESSKNAQSPTSPSVIRKSPIDIVYTEKVYLVYGIPHIIRKVYTVYEKLYTILNIVYTILNIVYTTDILFIRKVYPIIRKVYPVSEIIRKVYPIILKLSRNVHPIIRKGIVMFRCTTIKFSSYV